MCLLMYDEWMKTRLFFSLLVLSIGVRPWMWYITNTQRKLISSLRWVKWSKLYEGDIKMRQQSPFFYVIFAILYYGYDDNLLLLIPEICMCAFCHVCSLIDYRCDATSTHKMIIPSLRQDTIVIQGRQSWHHNESFPLCMTGDLEFYSYEKFLVVCFCGQPMSNQPIG